MLVGEVTPASITRNPGSFFRRLRNVDHAPECRGIFGPATPDAPGEFSNFLSNQFRITIQSPAAAWEIPHARAASEPQLHPVTRKRQMNNENSCPFVPAMSSSSSRALFRCSLCDRRALRQVNLAAKHRIVFHRKSQCLHISLHQAACAQFHAAARDNVAFQAPDNQNILGRKIGGYICVRADREPPVCQVDGPFHLPVDNQIFTPFHYAANHNRLANPGETILRCHGALPSQALISASLPGTMRWPSCDKPVPTPSIHACKKTPVALPRTIRNQPGVLQFSKPHPNLGV